MEQERIKSSVYSGFSIEHIPSPISKRLVAYAIDLGIVTCIIYACAIPLMIVAGCLIGVISVLGLPDIVKTILAVFGMVALITFLMGVSSYYFIKGELKSGATFGKRLLGLKVISTTGKKLTFKQCLYRDLMRLVDGLLFLPGLLSMLLNKQNRRLGDLTSDTMVIYLEKQGKENDFLYIKQNEYHYFLELLQPKTPEIAIMEDYLTFSFQHFVRRKLDPEKASFWVEVARSHYKGEKGRIIDEETSLLFFAEFCHQNKLSAKEEKPIEQEKYEHRSL